MVPQNVLVVTASPRGADSYSVPIAEAFVEALGRDVRIDRLDAFELAPFVARHAEAKMAVIARRPVPERAGAEWAQVQALGARVTAADLLVFAVPMWNGGIPWALKLFIDTVTQPGIAFRFDPETGYHGLLGGRRAVTVYTSRVFPRFGPDHQSTYLRWWLRFCGIEEIHELRLQPTYPAPDLDRAIAQARDLAGSLAR
jgi:FMN-dependent NADH-azoreductase